MIRCVLQDKTTWEKIQVVAINVGSTQPEFTAHMFKYDTLMGIFPGVVSVENDELIVDGHRIKILSELNPANALLIVMVHKNILLLAHNVC